MLPQITPILLHTEDLVRIEMTGTVSKVEYFTLVFLRLLCDLWLSQLLTYLLILVLEVIAIFPLFLETNTI